MQNKNKNLTPEQLQAQVEALHRSTQSSFSSIAPLHEKLRTKIPVYRRWHQNRMASSIHKVTAFAFVFAFLMTTVLQMGFPLTSTKPNQALAGSTSVTWTSQADFTNNNGATGNTTQSQVDLTASAGDLKQGLAGYDPGNGADGPLIIAQSYDINSDNVSGAKNTDSGKITGRTTADAVNFSVTTNTTSGQNQITISTTPTGLAINDEVLVVSLQGTTADYSNVGLYEFKRISAINTNTLTLNANLSNSYNGVTQKIMVQRVPNYTNITINSGGSIIATAWNGTKGGVLAFRANNTITISATTSINMNGKGNRGGVGQGYGAGQWVGSGETYFGLYNNASGNYVFFPGNGSNSNPGGGGGGGSGYSTTPWTSIGASGTSGPAGGGGGIAYCGSPGSGGGGGYGSIGLGGTSGGDGQNGSGMIGGSGGNGTDNVQSGSGGGGGSFGDSAQLESRTFFGTGGGGGAGSYRNPATSCNLDSGTGGNGGTGGGIVFINAENIINNGTIASNGNNGGTATNSFSGDGGGGSGGSITVVSKTINNTGNITANGGTSADGGNGGGGRTYLKYYSKTGNNPTPNLYSAQQTPYYSPGTLGGTTAENVGLRVDGGAGKTVKATSLTWNAVTGSAGQKVLFKVRSGNTQAELDSSACYGPSSSEANPCSDWTTAGKFFSQINGQANSGTSILNTIPAKRYIEVLVRMESDGSNTPTLNDVTLTYDSLEAPVNSNMSMWKSDALTQIGANGEGSAWTNETTTKFKATNLTCSGCATSPTNLRIQVENKAVGTAFNDSGSVGTDYIEDGGTGDQDASMNGFVTLSGLSVGGTGYHWRARTVDDQGRVSGWTSYGNNAESTADFTVEQTAPTGTVSINSGATYTNNTAVTLTLTASDTGGSSPTSSDIDMWVSNNSDFSTGAWETFVTSKAWTIPSGDGEKTVYVKFRDKAGNQGPGTARQFSILEESDDARAFSTGAWDNSQIWFGSYNGSVLSVFRFKIDLPQTAIILSSDLTIPSENGGLPSSSVTFNNNLIDSNNTPVFTSNPYSLSVTSTTIQKTCSFGTCNPYVTPDISQLVRDFLNMQGYQSDNYIGLKVSYSSGGSYFIGGNNGAILNIVYVSGATDTITLDQTAPETPSDTLVSPNGGESWAGGSDHEVVWDSTKIAESGSGLASLKLQYSTNNQGTWNDIVGAETLANGQNNCSLLPPEGGCYKWRVPNVNTTQTYVRIIGTDTASNITGSVGVQQFTPDTNNTAFSIVQDATAPDTFELIGPGNAGDSPVVWRAGSVTLSWNASADTQSGIDYYELWTKESADPAFAKNGSNISPSQTTVSTNVTFGEGTWSWYVKAINGAILVTQSTSTFIFHVDTTAPAGSILILTGVGGNIASPDAIVDLQLSATDAGSGLTGGSSGMQFSNNNSLWSSFENYGIAPSNQWDLTDINTGGTGTDGTKTVYVKYRDAVGNTSNSFNDTVIYDLTNPTGPSSINAVLSGVATSGAVNAVDISWSGDSDTPSGIASYSIYRSEEEGTGFSLIGTDTAPPYQDTNRTDGHTYYYRVEVVDNAGRTSNYLTGSFGSVAIADVSPPDLPASFFANGVDTTKVDVTFPAFTDNGIANGSLAKTYYLDRTGVLGTSQPTCGVAQTYSKSAIFDLTNGVATLTQAFPADGADTLDYASGNFTYHDISLVQEQWYCYRVKATDIANNALNTWTYAAGRGNFAPVFSNFLVSPTANLAPGDTVTVTYNAVDEDGRADITAGTINAGHKITIKDGQNGGGNSGTVVLNNATISNLVNYTDGQSREGYSATYTYQIPANAIYGTYTVFVNVKDSVGSGTHDLTNYLTFSTPPPAPTGLTLSGYSSTQIKLDWASPPNGGVKNYRIERAPDLNGAPGAFSEVANKTIAQSACDADTACTFTDSGLTSDTKYWYKLRAEDISSTNGAYTTNANYTTPTPGVPNQSSLKVMNGTAEGENTNRFMVVWGEVAADQNNNTTTQNFSTYVVERADDCTSGGAGACENGDFAEITQTSEKYYVNENLDSSLYYVYRVRTKDSFNNVSKSSLAPIIEAAPRPNINEQPIEVGVSSARVKWTSDQQSETIVVYGNQSNNYSNTAGDPSLKNAGDLHDVSLSGLTPNTTYYYKIISKNNIGLANDFTEKSFKTSNFTISGVTVDTTTTTATINWSTNGINADSTIEYSADAAPGEAQEQSQVAGDPALVASHSVTIKALKPNREYTYKVRSVTSDKYVAETSFAKFKTKPYDASQFIVSPNASNISEVDIKATSAKLTWTTSIATTSWVDYGTQSGNYTNSAGDSKFNTAHVVELFSLTPGQKYYYVVRGKDTNGIEYVSQEYTFTAVLLPEISGVKVTNTTHNSATITWTTNTMTDSLVEFGNSSAYGLSKGDPTLTKTHEVTLEDLDQDKTYNFRVVSVDSVGNKTASLNSTFVTKLDTEPPVISTVKQEIIRTTDASGEEKVVAIISWSTDEDATSQVEFGLGLTGAYTNLTIADESLKKSHSVIISNLKPASTYHFRTISEDLNKNQAKSDNNTMLTPAKQQSIFQKIIKALEESFAWVKNLREFVVERVNKVFGN